MSPAARRSLLAQPVTFWVVLMAVVVATALLIGSPAREGPPLDPDSTGPLGTRALVLLLEDLGADVDVIRQPPAEGDDVALVLADDLDEAGRQGLTRWVAAGGTLVVADPGSRLHPFTVEGSAGPAGTTMGSGRCDIPALAGVEDVDPSGGVTYDVPPGAAGCFAPSGADASAAEETAGAFVAIAELGRGTVVAVGGAGSLTNGAIGSAGNGVLAAALLAPVDGTRVAFLQPPAPGSGSEGLLDLVGDDVRQALAQLGVAFGLYAWWRGRRLGRPVAEPQPVALEASELVAAVGHLLHQAGRHHQAATLLGDDLRRHLAERLGLAVSAPADAVAEVAAERTGIPTARLLALLTPSGTDGADDLVRLATAADAVRREVAGVH